jgi:acetyl-CoA acyltransferase 2
MSLAGHQTGVVFLSGARTGFGAFGGALKDLSATDLGALAGAEALARSGVAPADVDHVVMGNVAQTSADAPYLARHVGLRVGAPIETPALTVNRLCGSGFGPWPRRRSRSCWETRGWSWPAAPRA